MSIRIKTLTPYSYSIKADAIKRKLARFKDADFLRQFYKHFHELRDKENGIAANFPWCCYLALKWKFTTPQNKDALEMKYEDFVNIINRVYDLQSEASNLNAENNVILGIRRMMINQFLYQQTDKFNFASLIRQYIWYCEEGAFYEERFESKTGLSLKNFYRMASYFIIVSSINDATDSEVFPYKIFIMHWSPIVGVEQVKQFLMLISLKPDEIRSFLEPYKFTKPLTIEYYEDTPMLRKPVLMAQEGAVVLSKKILKAALVNLVPELFKSSFKEEYKVAFGKTLENYTAKVFINYNYNFINEATIKKIYQENKLEGKSVDFILRESDGRVLIDCKAIEPAPFVKVTSDPKKIRERLESSFIKGIFQGEHTAYNLTHAKAFNDTDKLSMFIVVHRDHYLSHGLDVEALIYPSLTSELEKKYGRLPIPLSRIYYITIDGLETLLNVCVQKRMTLNEFIDRCSAVDSGGQRKANIDMHMFELMPEGVKDMDKLKEVGDYLFKDVFEVIGESGKIWNGEVEQYISMLSYILNK